MALPTAFGVELSQVPPQAVAYQPLRPNQAHGRMRIAFFTLAVAAQAQNLLVGLAYIPKGARILEGKFAKSATAGATVNFDFGLSGKDGNGNIDDTVGATVADSPALLGNVANTGAASVDNFCETAAENMGYVTKKECILTMTVKDAAVSAAATITGYVIYVLD